jgi:15,16-dihydrobiliverdin:ferredoxin oxidoreductase
MKATSTLEEKELKIRFNQILCEEMGRYFELSPLPLDPDFKVKYSDREGKDVFITSEYLGCTKTGGLRFGEMDFGGSMLVDYGSVPPAHNYDFPILGFDFVLASRFVIGVIDLHPLSRDSAYTDTYITPIKDIFRKYQWIPKAEGGRSEMHEWAKAYDSGYSFYRWCDPKYLPDIEEAFRDYVKAFCECIRKAEPITDQKILARRNEYMQRYRDDYTYKDPGSAPLKHYFGEEWGEQYLKDFIFGL